MLAMLLLRGCTWCNGDLYLDWDHLGTYLKCLQCGRERVIPEDWLEADDDCQTSPPPAVRAPRSRIDGS